MAVEVLVEVVVEVVEVVLVLIIVHSLEGLRNITRLVTPNKVIFASFKLLGAKKLTNFMRISVVSRCYLPLAVLLGQMNCKEACFMTYKL